MASRYEFCGPYTQPVNLVAAIGLTTIGGFAILNAFVVNPAPQSGLVFWSLPIYQNLGLAFLFVSAAK